MKDFVSSDSSLIGPLDDPLSPLYLWNRTCRVLKHFAPFVRLQPQIPHRNKSDPLPQWQVITTDASLLGWGAVFRQHTAQGRWTTQEALFPINLLEIRAIFLPLIHWQSLLTNLPIRIQSDSATAVAYLNHQGRTRSGQVMEEAAKILRWAERHVPAISAVHIPWVENWATDFLSLQGLAAGEWSLRPAVFDQICLRWGTPDVDLMASRMNHKVPQFVARSRDPLAVGHDALVIQTMIRARKPVSSRIYHSVSLLAAAAYTHGCPVSPNEGSKKEILRLPMRRMEALLQGMQEKKMGTLFGSCEAELQELMRQIDIMLEHKKSEWEAHTETLNTLLQLRDQELSSARTREDRLSQEIRSLRRQLSEQEETHRTKTADYESQLARFQEEVCSNLYYSHRATPGVSNCIPRGLQTGGRSRPPTSSSSTTLVTYFACSSCNSKLPSGQSSPLCQSCSNPIAPTAQDPPAVPPESDPPIPGWAASLSQSVADLTRVSQTLVSALDRLPLQTPAVASGSQEPPPEPSLISHKRSRQERRSESSSRSISPHGPPPRLVSHRSSSPESGEALSDAPSEEMSELDPSQIATMSESVQNLIRAINQTCGIKDPSTEPADQAVSFRRAKPPSKFFAPHPEFEEILARERENPTRRFQRGKRLGVLYPFSPDLTANWTVSPSVDPPVSRLSTNTVLPLSGGASLKDSNDRVIESFAKSAFEAASAALCPAFASTWASKSISKWAKDLRRGILDGAPPAQLAELANQISHAGEYLVSASLDVASCAAQASSNAVAIRRTVWLKAWQADLSSKKSLTSLPFQGSRLFGSQLDQIIKDATGGTSSLLPQAKPRRPPPRRQFRSFRPFRRFAASNAFSQQQQRPQARQEKKAVSFRPTPSWRPRYSQGRSSRPRTGRSTSA
ncbi:unnamed protein product [Ranitomeya imitator]|uniref:Uncharacterized protein n=1 Tax=Ranitomeya imitator TaxID=111125 RepID=A0ABN9L756_9NEOB|nr:unnamed protein product [Ranitomeya imitator]